MKRKFIKVKRKFRRDYLSIVTPTYNEEDTVEDCVNEVRKIMFPLQSKYRYEHLFVDNASTDQTLDFLRRIARKDKRVKVIVNSKNVGPFRSIWNALNFTSGNIIIPFLPADMQDPPSAIPLMLELNKKGHDVVFGVRKSREDHIVMAIARRLFYFLFSNLSDSRIPRNAGEFLLMNESIKKDILTAQDEYPYMRNLVAECGKNIAIVEYQWKRRKSGKSKNRWYQLIDQALNALVSSTIVPARLVIFAGFAISGLSLFAGFVNTFWFFLNDGVTGSGIPTLIVTSMFMGGIQLFFLGIVIEYVLSIHGQVRKKPRVRIDTRINI
jgi:polyisoprenyl-phosphate glycosyltransferase